MSAYSDIVLWDEPLGYYRLGESSGTVAADSSGNGNDGTYVGGPTLGATGAISGDADTAVETDGNDDEITLPLSPGFDFTVEGWWNLDTGRFLWRDDTNTDGWILFASANPGGNFTIRIDGANKDTGIGVDSYTGSYHHYVVKIEGAALSFWIDGSEVYTESVGTSINTAPASPLHIMRNGSSSVFTEGAVDEVAVYDFALADDRIAHHYAVGSGTANTAPDTPSIDLVETATVTTSTADLTGSDFSDSDTGDEHRATQWQLDEYNADFSDPVYDSGTDTTNLIFSPTITGLEPFTRYKARVRHQDILGDWSSWSAEVDVATPPTTLSADPFAGGEIKYVEVISDTLVRVARHFSSDDDLENLSGENQTLEKVLIIGGGGGTSNTTVQSSGGGGAGAVLEVEDVLVNAGQDIPVRPGAAGTTGSGGDSVLWVDPSGDALDPGSDPVPSATEAEGGGGGKISNGGDGGSGGGGGSGSGGESPSVTSGGQANDQDLGNDGGGGSGTAAVGDNDVFAGGGGGSLAGEGASVGLFTKVPGAGGAYSTLAEFGVLAGAGGEGGYRNSRDSPTVERGGDGGLGAGAGAGGNAASTSGGAASGGLIVVVYQITASINESSVPGEPVGAQGGTCITPEEAKGAFLDRRLTESTLGVSASHAGSTTTWTLPYSVETDGSEGEVVVTSQDTGEVYTVTRPAANQVAVTGEGDLSEASVFIGVKYSFQYDPTTLFYRERGVPDSRGRLTLRYVVVRYHQTTDLTVTVSTTGRADATYTVDEDEATDGELRIPIRSRNTETSISITNDTPGSSAISYIEWEGSLTHRSRRV